MSSKEHSFSFTAKLEKFDSNLWHYHVEVPEDVALSLIEKDNKRVCITLNNSIQWQAAIMRSAGYWFVLVNEKNRKKLELNIGNEVQVNLCKDHSEYGHSMIEEFQVLLDQDDDFRIYFESLTMGKKRSLLYWASQVKNSDSRLKRVIAIAGQLKDSEGQLDFKIINARLKQLNSR